MMPKGVDHLTHVKELIEQNLVQKSLMPKGVDHSGWLKLVTHALRAKIFDAERR